MSPSWTKYPSGYLNHKIIIMNIPKSIKTDERIFKATTFDGDTFLFNLNHVKLTDLQDFKKLWHLWNLKFESCGKDQLKTMINNR